MSWASLLRWLKRENPDVFSFLGRLLGCDRGSELFGRHEILFSAFYSQQPGDHFPCDGQRGPIAIAALHLLFLDQGQFRAPS